MEITGEIKDEERRREKISGRQRGVTQGRNRQKNYMFRKLVYPDSESHVQLEKWTLSPDFLLLFSVQRKKEEKIEQGNSEQVC